MTTPFDMSGGGFYDPALAGIMATKPELLIPALAAAGIAPPREFPSLAESGVIFSGQPPTPTESSPFWPSTAPLPMPQPEPATRDIAGYGPLPESPFDVPMPQPRPSAPMVATPTTGGNPFPTPIGSPAPTAKAPGGSDLMKAMQGVKAPPAPGIQKIDSPRIPGASSLPQQSPLIGALINAMSGKAAAMPDILRLSQTLGGR